MNRIKAHGEETKKLLNELKRMREDQVFDLVEGVPREHSMTQLEESMRCLNLAKDYLQTGQMWFVRAVALPQSF